MRHMAKRREYHRREIHGREYTNFEISKGVSILLKHSPQRTVFQCESQPPQYTVYNRNTRTVYRTAWGAGRVVFFISSYSQTIDGGR